MTTSFMKRALGMRPVMGGHGGPSWWNSHGRKLTVKSYDVDQGVILEASAARLQIHPITDYPDAWQVIWRVKYSPSSWVEGRIEFLTEELEAAFGLSELSGYSGDWLISNYGADAAQQGKFIRYQEFLNIANPGTGHDGDLNISVEVDEIIQQAVGHIINLRKK